MTEIQGLYVINPKTKKYTLLSTGLSFKTIEEITSYLLRKIAYAKYK